MITNPRAIGRILKTGANTFALLPLKWDSIQIDQKPGKISQGHKFYLKRYILNQSYNFTTRFSPKSTTGVGPAG